MTDLTPERLEELAEMKRQHDKKAHEVITSCPYMLALLDSASALIEMAKRSGEVEAILRSETIGSLLRNAEKNPDRYCLDGPEQMREVRAARAFIRCTEGRAMSIHDGPINPPDPDPREDEPECTCADPMDPTPDCYYHGTERADRDAARKGTEE